MSTPGLTLQQKGFRTGITYRFFDDYVEYSIVDSRGDKASFNVKYDEVPGRFEYRTFQPRRPYLLFQLMILLSLTVLLLLIYPSDTADVLAFMTAYGMFILGTMTLLRRQRYFRRIYTSVPTRNGRLLVLRDGATHDRVLEELETRRRRSLRRHAMIDTLNSPQAELRKLRWLRDEGAITDTEYGNFSGALGIPLPPEAAVAPEGAALELTQKALHFRADFSFHRNHLAYAESDGGMAAFNVHYDALPHPTEYRTLAKKDIFPGIVFCFGLLAGMVLLNLHAGDSYYIGPVGARHLAQGAALFLPALALAVYAAHRWSRKEFTLVPVPMGVIRVLHDDQRDQVLAEIQSRRYAALKAFAVIDEHNAPQKELRKFMWLKDQGIITEQEFEIFRHRLQEAAGKQPDPPAKPPTETLH